MVDTFMLSLFSDRTRPLLILFVVAFMFCLPQAGLVEYCTEVHFHNLYFILHMTSTYTCTWSIILSSANYNILNV